MINEGVFLWLESWPVSVAFAESMLMYPVVLGVHVIALALSVGILALVDLRLAGVLLEKHDWREVVTQLRPWFVLSFVLILATGVLLFLPMASHFADSRVFWIKMLLIVLAGINALAFEVVSRREQRGIALNDSAINNSAINNSAINNSAINNSAINSDGTVALQPRFGLRVFALCSLALWVSVIALGRVLAYI